MANEIVPRSATSGAVELYQSGGALGQFVSYYLEGRSFGPGTTLGPVPDDVIEAARVRLRQVEQMCLPITDERVMPAVRWLTDLAQKELRGVPAGKDELRRSTGTLIGECDDIPVGAWSEETRKAFSRQYDFWPTPHRLHEHLKPYAAALYSERAALQGLMASASVPKTEPPADRPKSQEEIERILTEFRPRYTAAVADARRQAAEDDARLKPASPKPAYLTPEQLRAARNAAALERIRGR